MATSVRQVKVKKTKLVFFLHDHLDLEKPEKGCVKVVAEPRHATTPFLPFGTVLVFDDKITEGPGDDSKVLGRAQGTYISDGIVDPGNPYDLSFLITFTANFEDGSISFHGHDPMLKPVREIAVVGGSGKYRFATGYAKIYTHEIIPPTSSIVKVEAFIKQEVDEAEDENDYIL